MSVRRESLAGDSSRRAGTVSIRVEVVKRELDRRLWSIADLATEAGLHRSTVDLMPEAGLWEVRRTTAHKIATAFEQNPVREMVDELLAPEPAAGG